MISEIFWLVPQHVLYWKLSGNVPGSEISAMAQFIEKQIEKTSDNKVHIVLDCGGLTKLDYTNKEARASFSVLAKQKWMGQVVAIVRNDPIQIQMNALSSAFGLEWKNVTSMHLAIRSLKASDRLLQNVPERISGVALKRPEKKKVV